MGTRAARGVLLGLGRGAAVNAAGSIVLEEDGRWPRLVAIGREGPIGRVRVHDRRAYAAVLRHGSVGLADSYAAGWWDADDLTEVVRALFQLTSNARRRLDRLASGPAGAVVAAARTHAAPGAAADRRHVAAHYDLSNEFFSLMLGPTMAYSCALFERPGMTLEEAQTAKFDRLASGLGLGPHDHVVEIGTGWGGFALHLAERYGCRVTTTTISERQRSFAAKRVAERGLSDRVTVLGEHYRDLAGTYDALVSVEMVEAVDWRHHDEFFAACARLLTPTGRMGLQAITMADQSFDRAKQHRDFVRKRIFPGGCIPSVASITRSVARATDLRVVSLDDIGGHYPETLRCWRETLLPHRNDVARLGFDERFWREWQLYLSYCEAAFVERHISDVQVVLARPHWHPAGAQGEVAA